MTHIRRVRLPALLFALFPLSSYAEAGELGQLINFALVIVVTLWGALVLGVFLALRRWPPHKRFGYTVLAFFSPVLYAALVICEGYALGAHTRETTETTRETLIVAGIDFPPGSRARYEQKRGWLGLRELLYIESPSPILLGGVRINGLQVDGNDRFRLMLNGDQTIDGWPCSAAFIPTVTFTAERELNLKRCLLAEPRVWRGKVIPAGTYVFADEAGKFDFIQR